MTFSAFQRATLVAALGIACAAPASATGTVRIQQSDNSVQNYTGVVLKLTKKSLTIESADKVSTVLVTGGDCAPSGDMTRCTGGTMTITQDGKPHPVNIKNATFYFNLKDQDATFPMSSMKLAPHSVMFFVKTAKGTFVTGSGKLDEEMMQ